MNATATPIEEIIGEPIDTPLQDTPETERPKEVVTITLPIGQLHNGYLSNHIEARLATERQRKNMRRILNGLREKGAKLENGRFVDTQADMFKWILEQVE